MKGGVLRGGDVLRGEIVKACTLRGLRITVVVSIVVAIAYCLLDASPELGLSTPQTAGVYAMANFSFFAAITGVLIASSEYGGGQLTTSALAVANRGRMLAAKLIVSAVVATVLALVLAVGIAVIVQAPLGDRSVYVTGTAGPLLTSLALAVASWTGIGLIGTCAAVVVRSQTIVLTAMVVLSFGGTPLMMAVPAFEYLPTNAGVLMYIDRGTQTADWLNPPDLTAPLAAIVLTAWCTAAIIAAMVVLKRRDIGTRQAVLE